MMQSGLTTIFCCFSLLSAVEPAKLPNKQPLQTKSVKAFKPFTGKITANKVRMRTRPDLEGHIIRQVQKNDLFLVVGEENDFYAIEPPKETKAFVFRSYILDDTVEANRVNIRLEPHQDAPVIGQLEAGAKVKSHVSPINHKWLEITPPKTTHFYVSKEFVTSAGGPDYLTKMTERKGQVNELLNVACNHAESECKKSYEDMSIFTATEELQTILKEFSDFPEQVATAKEALATLKETYLNKKIAYLEARAELSPVAKEELIAKHKEETKEILAEKKADQNFFEKRNQKREVTAEMRLWDTMEESLYLSWTAFHSGKKMSDFYEEQKVNASVLTGKIESCKDRVKDKPGDFILQGREGPKAYLYSTQIDLEKHKGKQVTVMAAPRPNNHFAYPAYFVLSIE